MCGCETFGCRDGIVSDPFFPLNFFSRGYIGDRVLMAFRFNLLHHIGTVSSLREQESPPYPACFEFLGQPVNFEVRFLLVVCSKSASPVRHIVYIFCFCTSSFLFSSLVRRWRLSTHARVPTLTCGRVTGWHPMYDRPFAGYPLR